LEARNATESSNRRLAEANRLIERALVLQREGKSGQADALVKQAQQVQAAPTASALTASELSELDRLRREETAWRRNEADLRNQLAQARADTSSPEVAPAPKAEVTGSERGELERLRNARSNWERDTAQLQQQLAAANDRAMKLQQAESSLRRINDDLQARLEKREAAPASASTSDISSIQQLLRDYQAAYQRRDAEAVARLMPSAKAADLARSFSQLRAYEMEILNPQISVAGDTAVVTCTRRVAVEPRVGSRPAPRLVPTVFRLKQSAGVWTIESVEEKR
jgi:ketosteroid isomerase-like protein